MSVIWLIIGYLASGGPAVLGETAYVKQEDCKVQADRYREAAHLVRVECRAVILIK